MKDDICRYSHFNLMSILWAQQSFPIHRSHQANPYTKPLSMKTNNGSRPCGVLSQDECKTLSVINEMIHEITNTGLYFCLTIKFASTVLLILLFLYYFTIPSILNLVLVKHTLSLIYEQTVLFSSWVLINCLEQRSSTRGAGLRRGPQQSSKGSVVWF